MHLEKIEYKGWPNCYQLSNDIVDLIVTTDVGPRIIRFGFIGGPNEFKEYTDLLGKTGGNEWRIYGGHRLWHAPEEKPRTYFPDNSPVSLEQHPGFVRIVQPAEPTTGIQKEIDIQFSPDAAWVQLTHRLRNTNLWSVELAPWALTVMAQGGTAIVPLPPRGSHTENLLPSNTLTLWSYTNMSDSRWTWGKRFILLRQDPSAEVPQKIGAMAPDGWIAYANQGHLFVKKTVYRRGAPYLDFGCSLETFTNADMLEIETLGPVVLLPPGSAVEHVETWLLFRDITEPTDDASVERYVLPRLAE